MPEPKITDHLANERTFLAWVRTAIALMGFGVVIAKLRFLTVVAPPSAPGGAPVGTRSTLLGIAFAAVGLLTLAFAAVHYHLARRAILAGNYLASGTIITLFAAVIFVLGLASVLYLLSLVPH